MTRHFWTTTELAAIREHYPTGGITALEPLLPGRTRTAIYQQARIMGLKSLRQDPVRGSWPNTPEVDEAIRAAHATPPKKGDIAKLAKRLGRPEWSISKRARELGLVTPRFREAPWSDAELKILEETTELTPERARLRMRAAGFERSATAIVVKRKRQGIRQPERHGAHSASEVARLLGYDPSTAKRWIHKGLLKAKAIKADRADRIATEWEVTDRDLREFIIQNPMAIQLRRIPAAHQPWFIELLTGRGPMA